MTYLVARTCTEVVQSTGERVSRLIEEFRDRSAYILLGDPGSGKTESFKAEAKACGGFYVSARDFLTLSFPATAVGKILFIDGLDESRAGEGDGRTPLDRLRTRLDGLGRPSFRLSCREADWLGSSDRNALLAVVPTSELSVIHLDQLTRHQVQDILDHHPTVLDPAEFLKNAEERGLDALLQNPQTLNLLIEAVKGNEWPSTRQETFRLACEKLAAEHNVEHRTAYRGQRVDTAAILNAAGGLCAIQLLADISGFTDIGTTSHNIVALRDIGWLSGQPVSQALKTRLFVGIGEEQLTPAHRSIAEYLAANFLTQIIEKGNVSMSRVLALITAADGGVVAGLRGLNAWLSVLNPESRRRLIQIDPLGITLYGDAKLFSVEDKLTLLKALHILARQYSGFRWQDWSAKPFGALATADMVEHLKSILVSPLKDEGYQAFLDCVLDAVRYGDPLPELKDELRAIAVDATRWPSIRKDALKAYMRLSQSEPDAIREIAEGIRDGIIEDSGDELLGILLHDMFPQVIKAEEVFSYRHKPKDTSFIGMYHFFWSSQLSETARDADIPILMDVLISEKPLKSANHDDFMIRKMVSKLLRRAILEHGEKVTDELLYEWLGLSLNNYGWPQRLEREDSAAIKDWLEAHPERYKGLLLIGISKCANAENFQICTILITRRLFMAKPPEDLGLWWLARAEEEQDQTKADCFFNNAIEHFFSGQSAVGLSVDFFEKWVEERPRFAVVYRRSTYQKIPDWQRKHAKHNQKYKEEQQKKREGWMQNFRSHLPRIRTGDAPPKVLHDLASAYLGHLMEADGETGMERLHSFLDNDEELISAALEGFCRAIERPGLPTVKEILELNIKGRVHYIAAACLAGLEERYKVDPSQVLGLSDNILEKAIAFQYSDLSKERDWFNACVRDRTDVVAKVLIKHVKMQVKAKKEHIEGVYPLAHNEEYASVARMAVAPLLRTFPTRSNKKQVSYVLGDLLKSALRYMGDEELKRLINEKLTIQRMDIMQRIYWLAAGIIVDSRQYDDELRSFVGKSPTRIQSLASFFIDRFESGIIRDEMRENTLSYLIQIFAPTCSPEWPRGAHFVSAAMETADFVRALVNRLGGTPTGDASQELQNLLQDSSLSSWHRTLRHALHTQAVSIRETTFRHPTVKEVCDTLGNGSPANAADLAALATEHLQQLANEIRHGNTDQYKQFWNVDKHARPEIPRPEDACRDTLLERLKDRLRRFGVDAIPEGHYADDKRADIRISRTTSNASMAIPIEVKRDSHPDIWKAISDQLIDLYTREPESKGRGIFIAFWFGVKKMPAPPNGDKPTTAGQLETLLVSLIPVDKRELISVCVIDCSLPKNKK